jgi:hypothetical protein
MLSFIEIGFRGRQILDKKERLLIWKKNEPLHGDSFSF